MIGQKEGAYDVVRRECCHTAKCPWLTHRSAGPALDHGCTHGTPRPTPVALPLYSLLGNHLGNAGQGAQRPRWP